MKRNLIILSVVLIAAIVVLLFYLNKPIVERNAPTCEDIGGFCIVDEGNLSDINQCKNENPNTVNHIYSCPNLKDICCVEY